MTLKTSILFFAVLLMLSACGKKTADDHEHKKGEKHEQEKPGAQQKDQKSEDHAGDKKSVKLSPEALTNAGIETAPATRQAIADTITATATISHNQDRLFHVTPRITGRVVDVRASIGSSVKAGSVLAVMDSTELGQAKAEYSKAQTLVELAKANYEREKSLFDQKIAAKKDALAAEAEYRKAEAEVRSLYERLRLYGLSDQQIKNLDDTPSRYLLASPGPGTVIERDISQGEVIEAGKKVFTISDLSTVWVLLNIYEKDLGKIQNGAAVKITTESYPDEVFNGKVAYVGDVLDPQTRTVPVRVVIKNPRSRLKPGMFATAEIITAVSSRQALTIPSAAIQKVEGKPAVFVQENDGSFAKREVELGQEFGGSVEVTSGLKEGESVVVAGGFTLKSELLKEGLEGHAH
ncbi:MAG TPA: efflux RND transporter periplasmic adaptor subunit [Candidatus Binatia bacterium]|nr:efflux RND transporter periplasmic adaptor subunit [Candidatus Binatia bacterium]